MIPIDSVLKAIFPGASEFIFTATIGNDQRLFCILDLSKKYYWPVGKLQ